MYQVIAIEEYVTEMIVLVTDPLGGLDPFYIHMLMLKIYERPNLKCKPAILLDFGLAGWKLVDCNGISF